MSDCKKCLIEKLILKVKQLPIVHNAARTKVDKQFIDDCLTIERGIEAGNCYQDENNCC